MILGSLTSQMLIQENIKCNSTCQMHTSSIKLLNNIDDMR